MTQAVLFHTHGLGRFDFSDLNEIDLVAINEIARRRDVLLCPTIFLTECKLDHFETLLCAYAQQAQSLERIVGWAIEGPMLGSKGGTPVGAIWRPTAEQWRQMARWFDLGLKYMVMAPDIFMLGDDIGRDMRFADLITLIYASGGRIALGHFEGQSAVESARRLEAVLGHIEEQFKPSPYLVLTDHLFNDMPRAFKHAFRTSAEMAERRAELARHEDHGWRAATLDDLLGHVPAALLRAARAKRLTPSLNFDGGHVDLEICRQVVAFLGAKRLIAITDHTELLSLGGEVLRLDAHTRLLYRSDSVLAASFVTHEEQRVHMRSIGMSEEAIFAVQHDVPLEALRYRPCRK